MERTFEPCTHFCNWWWKVFSEILNYNKWSLLEQSKSEQFCGLLNPHSRYVKVDADLPQFLCHMTSDVKFSHMLISLIYVAVQKLYSTK